MSKKENYIALLREARVEFKKWLNGIRLVVSGLEKDKNKIALNPSESHFGEWLYSRALTYPVSNSKLVLTEIELLFEQCYEEYHNIYSLLLGGKENSLFSSLFGNKKASASDYKIAGQYYDSLLQKSDKLLQKLHLFENQLSATNAQKFEMLDFAEPSQIQESKPKKVETQKRYYRGSLIED